MKDKKGKADETNDDGEENADADVLDGDVEDKGTVEDVTEASEEEELIAAAADYFATACLKNTPAKESK